MMHTALGVFMALLWIVAAKAQEASSKPGNGVADPTDANFVGESSIRSEI